VWPHTMVLQDIVQSAATITMAKLAAALTHMPVLAQHTPGAQANLLTC
jgi:hypothetical protein